MNKSVSMLRILMNVPTLLAGWLTGGYWSNFTPVAPSYHIQKTPKLNMKLLALHIEATTDTRTLR